MNTPYVPMMSEGCVCHADNCRRIHAERPSHYSQLNQQPPAFFYDRNQQNQRGGLDDYRHGNQHGGGQQTYGPPNHQNQGNRGNHDLDQQKSYSQNLPNGGRHTNLNLVGVVSQQFVPQLNQNQLNRFNNGPQIAQ
jgi:hypothetical protein